MKNATKIFIRLKLASIVILSLALSSKSKAQLNVLVCGGASTASWNTDVDNKLTATGLFNNVDVFQVNLSTPTLALLQNYNSVLVYSDASYFNAAALGDVLAQYIDGGGGVVLATFDIHTSAGFRVTGTFDNATYRVMNPGSQVSGTMQTLGTVYLPLHAVMNGVSSFNGGTGSYRISTSTIYPGSGAYKIADWNSGEILAAARDNAGLAGNKKRVDLNFYPPSSTARSDFWSSSTDGAKLMANALIYVGCNGIVASGPTKFCGTFGTLSLTAPVGLNYLWSGGETTQTIVVTTVGNYAVTVDGAPACNNPISVTLNPIPTISAGSTTTFCSGGSVVLTSSAATGNLWSTGAVTQSITVSTTGNYTVTANGCSSVATAVTVNANPGAITTSGGPVCAGSNLNLTATSSGATSYSWTGPNLFVSTLQNPTIPTVTAAEAGVYTVVSSNALGCTTTATRNVAVGTVTPTITAGGPTTFCSGGSVVLTSSEPSGNVWSTGSTSTFITVSSTSVPFVTTNGCVSASVPVTVNVLPGTFTASNNGPLYCAGNTLNLTATAATNATSYAWSGPNFFTSTNQNESIVNATNTASGIYTVTASTINGCTRTATTSASVFSSALSGTYTVGLTGAYTTLTAAVNAYNTSCISGAVIFELIDATYPTETFPITINPNPTASQINNLKIRPATGTSPLLSGTSSTSIIRLSGADWVTLDGSNNGTNSRNWTIINSSTATSVAVIHLSSAGALIGATNDTIKNLNISCGVNQSLTATTNYGIILSNISIGTTGTDNDNNTIAGNFIIKTSVGIAILGNSISRNDNNIVRGNIIGPTAFGADQIGRIGIHVYGQETALIKGNEIRFVGELAAHSATGADRAGIVLSNSNSWPATTSGANANNIIDGNLIHDIVEEKNTSAVGINIYNTLSPSNNTISNNVIYNIRSNGSSTNQAVGIGVGAGNGDKIVYNSIYMAGDLDPAGATTAAGNSAGIRIVSTLVTNLRLANNVVNVDLTSNTITLKHFAIIAPSSTYAWGTGNSDYNDFYVPTTNTQMVFGGLGTAILPTTLVVNLATWKTTFTPNQDVNSITANPFFSTTTNLQPNNCSPLMNAGSVIANVLNDYNLINRSSTTPTIGAFENNTGVAYTWYADVDLDSYGDPGSSIQACSQPVGYVANNLDCNDNSGSVYPGASEICGDGIDQDCNGSDIACASALNFDGTNDYIQLASPIVPTTGNFTVEFWINSTAASGFREFISQGGAGDAFYIGTSSTSALIRCGDLWQSTGVLLPLSQWVHIAVVKSGSNGLLYLNGIQVSSQTNYTISATGSNTLLGKQYGSLSEHPTATMDELRIWSKALSATEILAHMNCEISNAQTGLIANYHFNQGIAGVANPTINTLTDVSGNNNTGTLTNFALNGATSNWVTPSAIVSGTSCTTLTFYQDNDNDGYGNLAFPVIALTQPTGYVINSTDCNDADPNIHPATVATNGLVAYYPFDGNAIESVGATGGINGVVNGCTATTGITGAANSAFHFQGTSWIDVANNAVFNFGTGDYSMSLWLKYTSPQNNGWGYSMGVCKDGFNSSGFQFFMDYNQSGGGSNGALTYRSSGGVYTAVQLNGLVNNGSWHNHVYMRSGNQLIIYVDGIQRSSAVVPVENLVNSYPVRFGANQDSPGAQNFQGDMDEVRFYNRALSAAEVLDLSNPNGGTFGEICNGIDDNCNNQIDEGITALTYYADTDGDGFGNPLVNQVACTPPLGYVLDNTDCNDAAASIYPGAIEICSNGIDENCDGLIDVLLPSGLKLYLPFGGNAYDASGLNHNGTVTNATLTTDRLSSANSAYDFNGSNAHIEVADHADLQPANFTLSTWVYYNSVPGGVYAMVGKPICGGFSDSYQFWFQGGVLNMGIGYGPNSLDYHGFSAPSINQWHHLAMTFDDVANELRYYIDNVLVGTFASTVSVFYDNTPLQIARDLENCSSNFNFTGKVDDVMLFNRVLTPIEIALVYNSSIPNEICNGLDDNCNGQIDEGVATTYFQDSDNDGYGNPLVSQVACTQPSGYVLDNTDCNDGDANINPGATDILNNGIDEDCNGSDAVNATALNFDGVDDFVAIPNHASLNSNTALTLEAWVYPTAFLTQYPTVIAKGNAASSYEFDLKNDGTIEMELNINGVNTSLNGSSISLNQWTHIASTYDGTTLKIFKNGIQVGSLAAPGTMGTNSNDVYIGSRNGAFFAGAIDEVRIWNRALGQAEILSHMNCEINLQQPNLVANYHFNHGVASSNNTSPAINTLVDASGNSNTGTLNNFTLNGATSNWVAPSAVTTGNNCQTVFYLDSDLDTYGNKLISINSFTQPPGYVLDSTDCDDGNINIHAPVQYYVDADLDGFGSTTTQIVCALTPPIGFATNNTDCNDNDINVWQGVTNSTIVMRSGNGNIGQLDSQIKMLVGPDENEFTTPFSPANFTAARTGPAPFVIVNHPAWASTLPADAQAKWINNTGSNGSGNSALFAYDFVLPSQPTAATLQLYFMTDNTLGGTLPGVYLNGQAISGNSTGAGYSAQTQISRSDIAPLLHAGLNTFYICHNDLGGPGAIIFSATIATQNANLFVDGDLDGYDNGMAGVCYGVNVPVGYSLTSNGFDCNDNNNAIHPGVAEICNGIDDDCNGQIDDGIILPLITAGGLTTFCTGGSVILTSPFPTNNLWSNGATTASITVAQSGSYVAVNTINMCGSAPTIVTVNPLPATPTITPNSPVTICPSGNAVLTSSAISGNVWSNGETTQSITLINGGNFTVITTDVNGCTSAPSLTTIVNNAVLPIQPTIGISAGSNPYCAGDSITLNVIIDPGVSYQWSNGYGTTPSVVVKTIGTTTTLTVVAISTDGCASVSAPSAPFNATGLPIVTPPTVTASGAVTFCQGDSVTLTSSEPNGNLWNNGLATQSIKVKSSGIFSVTKTDINGCTSAPSLATTVTVNALPSVPTISANGPTSFCSGSSVTLTANSNTGNAIEFNGINQEAQLGNWFNYQNFTIEMWVNAGATQVTHADIIDNNHTGARSWVMQQDGNNTNLYYYAVNGSPGGSVYFNLTPNTWQHLTFVKDGTQVLMYMNGALIGTAAHGGTVPYDGSQFLKLASWGSGGRHWNGKMDEVRIWNVVRTPAEIAANFNAIVAPNSTGLVANYHFDEGVGTTSADATSNAFNATLVNNPTWISNGGTVDYSWSPATFLSSTSVANPTAANVTATTTYTVTATNNATGCTSTTSITLTSSPLPTAPVISTNGATTFCLGNSVLLSSSEAAGNTWSTNQTTQSITASLSGNYSATVTIGGCTSLPSNIITVTTEPLPIVQNVTGGGSYCSTPGTGMPIGLSASENGATYQLFLNGSTPIGLPLSGNGLALSFGNQMAVGTYTVTAHLGNCSATMNGNAIISIITATTWYQDFDTDGFGNINVTQLACSQPPGYVANATDCDDNNINIQSSLPYFVDADLDGFGSITIAQVCSLNPPVGYSLNNTDCDDNNINIHEPLSYFVDADHDGFGSTTTQLVCALTPPLGFSNSNTDCNDANVNVYPGATEICNGIDDDCDGLIDDNDPSISGQPTWFADADADGFGDANVSQQKCIQPIGYISNNTDCNDALAIEHPGQVWFIDNDDDNFGTGATVVSCLRPPHGNLANELVSTTGDCNDNNAQINPVSQTLTFTSTTNFTNAVCNPQSGTAYTTFNFEIKYTDATNGLPPVLFPRVILDFEGNGNFNDGNDRTILMYPTDLNDLNTVDGKIYIGSINSLPTGSNWQTRVVINDGPCNITSGPYNYPDVQVLPDLQIFANDITFSTANPAIASLQIVSAVIHNESDFYAQNFYAHLVNQFDTLAIYPNVLVSSLAPHTSTTVSWNIITPAVPAWCPMQVSIDYTNVINESNELDNSAIRPFINGNYNLPGGIVVNGAPSPSSAYTSPGTTITIYGNALYYGTPVPLPDSSVAGATVTFTIPQTGASYSTYTNSNGYFSLAIPAPLIAGPYTVTGSVTDFTFTGNFATGFSMIAPTCLPDLVTDVVVSSTQIIQSNSISATITVYNQGCAATITNTILDVSQTGGLPLVNDVIIPPLNPGSSFTTTINSLTFNTPGLYSLCGTADATYLQSEVSEGNNSDCELINVIPLLPDIYPHGGPYGYTYICYGPANLGFSVGNSGGSPTGVFNCLIVIRKNGTIVDSIYHPITNIPALGVVGFSIPFTYPGVGYYTYELQCDIPVPPGVVTETFENNNIGTFGNSVYDCQANLAVSSCESFDVAPFNPVFPGLVTYSVVISNNGNATAFAPILVRFHLSSGTDYDVVYNNNLTPGQSATVTVNAPSVAPATQTLTAIVDPFNTIVEWNESDNSVSNSLCWDFQPVHKPVGCGNNFWENSYLVNQTVYLSVGLHNFNMYDASSVKVRFEVSGPGLPGTVNLGNAVVNNVEQSCGCPYTAVLPTNFVFPQTGTYTFTMTADPLGEYSECNEGNNILTVTINVTALPDMRILSQFIAPSLLNPDPGQPITMNVTYENIGYSNINDQMELKVLVDNVPLSTTYPVNGLVTGDNATIAIVTPWSSNLVGTHVIRAIIDGQNQIVETNELNNEATRAVVVGAAANLYFQVFASSNSIPNLSDPININARIGNNGDVDCEGDVQFFYVTNLLDTIQIGTIHVSVDNNDSTVIQLPWTVLDPATTLIGKIVNASVLEFTYDDNVATTTIGGMGLAFNATPSCIGSNNGTLTVSQFGGEPPYSYLWNTGYNAPSLLASAGNYTVTVTDNTGQSVSASGTITQSIDISIADSHSASLCNGINTGFINITVTNGTAPYSYYWSTAATTEDLTNLSSGTYTVTVTDFKGCMMSKSITINQLSSPVTNCLSSNNSCLPTNNGVVSVVATGGALPYSYSWSNGNSAASQSFLPPGTYQVTVTDNNNCKASCSAIVVQPNPLQLVISSYIQPTAQTQNGGSITTAISGGTLPYSYLWNDGSTTANRSNLVVGIYTVLASDASGCTSLKTLDLKYNCMLSAVNLLVDQASCFYNNGIMTAVASGGIGYHYQWQTNPVQTTATGTGLAYGQNSYCLITDTVTGCSFLDTVIVPMRLKFDIILQSPVYAGGTNIRCNGDNNGSINLTVTNTTGPFTYLWSNGATTKDLTNITAGTYTVTVSNLGCTMVVFTSLTQPSPLSTSITTTPTNSGGNTGTAMVTVAGGAGPYSYSWNTIPVKTTLNATGLSNGIYTVTIGDANGCTKTATAVITSNSSITVTGAPVNLNCNGVNTGSITLTATGGTSAYTYLWSNGSTIKNQTLLAAGTYTVTVTAANGSGQYSVTLTQPTVLVAIATATPVSCNGGINGTATATVSGGSPGYTYSWNSVPVKTTAIATGLKKGTYTCKITDSKGCIKFATINVLEPLLIVVNLSKTNVTTYGGNNGTAYASAIGGVSPYSYAWSTIPVKTTQTITGLTVGTYTVTVTDATGCTKTKSISIVQPSARLQLAGNEIDLYPVLYPNPSNGMVTISFDENLNSRVQIEVYSMTGEKLVVKSFDVNENATLFDLDLTHLSKGVYSIRYSTKDNQWIDRLILQ